MRENFACMHSNPFLSFKFSIYNKKKRAGREPKASSIYQMKMFHFSMCAGFSCHYVFYENLSIFCPPPLSSRQTKTMTEVGKEKTGQNP